MISLFNQALDVLMESTRTHARTHIHTHTHLYIYIYIYIYISISISREIWPRLLFAREQQIIKYKTWLNESTLFVQCSPSCLDLRVNGFCGNVSLSQTAHEKWGKKWIMKKQKTTQLKQQMRDRIRDLETVSLNKQRLYETKKRAWEGNFVKRHPSHYKNIVIHKKCWRCSLHNDLVCERLSE